VPLDQVVRALVAASGDPSRDGPAGFVLLASDPRDLSEHVGRMFLGAQIACARCHAHPADRWTQDDYHQFAAFFAQVARDGGTVRNIGRGEVDHPKSGKPVAPKPLGAPEIDIPETADRRLALADWITDPGSPFFARSMVNRVWKHLAVSPDGTTLAAGDWSGHVTLHRRP